MRRSKFTPEQIAQMVQDIERADSTSDACKALGISVRTYRRWRAQFGGDPEVMQRLEQLEDENSRLRRIVVDLTIDNSVLRDTLRKYL